MKKLANEFWNVIVGIIGGFIIGMVIHSAMGHTWGKRLWEIFHKDERPLCYGMAYRYSNNDCLNCKYNIDCEKLCRTFTE